MALTLGSLALAILLALNGMTVLNERRCLAKLGLDATSQGANPLAHGEGHSVKRQLASLLSAMRTVLRIPLIIVNVVVIVFLLLLG